MLSSPLQNVSESCGNVVKVVENESSLLVDKAMNHLLFIYAYLTVSVCSYKTSF